MNMPIAPQSPQPAEESWDAITTGATSNQTEVSPQRVAALSDAEAALKRAGFFRRFFSFLLDLAFLNFIYFVFLWIGITAMQMGLSHVELDRPSEDLMLSLASPLPVLWLILFFIYFTLFGFLGGQTPAKMLLGIQVRSITLNPLTWRQAALRTIGYVLSSLFFGTGFLWMLFNRDRRTLHDFIAGTCVIRLY